MRDHLPEQLQSNSGVPERRGADGDAYEDTPPPAKAEVLNETAHDWDQNCGHAQEAVMLLHQVPQVLRPSGSVILVGYFKLMLMEECKLQPDSLMSTHSHSSHK